jgi:radical SAM enzyme (TIGR01210 family)
VFDEREADGSGGTVPATTVFLTAAECPIGCTMCDLWQNTLPQATPPGAIQRQLDAALTARRRHGWIKLYNSGNFFDPRSIPPQDYASIARRCQPFSRVVVENHPRFGSQRLLRFRDLLSAPLEIAVGLETVQPRWLDRLGKQMTRGDFDRYADWLRQAAIDLRVFLIVGVPGVRVDEAIRWSRLSLRHAVSAGARHVSLIPARLGHGWNGLGDQLPTLPLDVLRQLQADAIDDAAGRAVVTIDLWDLAADAAEIQTMQRINLLQKTDGVDETL